LMVIFLSFFSPSVLLVTGLNKDVVLEHAGLYISLDGIS